MSANYQPSSDNKPFEQPASIDQLKLQSYLQEVRDNQNLTVAIFAGAGAAFLGAVAWAVVTAVTNFQIGFMAVGIGFLVGWSIRQFGRGIDKSFAIAGAVLSLMGCLVGNLLSSCIYIARNTEYSFSEVLSRLNPTVIGDIFKQTFSPMDLLFYGLALYFGYKYSLFQIPEGKLKELAKAG